MAIGFITEMRQVQDILFPTNYLEANVLYLDKVKSGQCGAKYSGNGATYELAKGKIDANYLYATNLYADFNPTYLTSVSDKGSLKLPSYGLVDAGFL
jgi:hypothetical protein